MSTISDVAKEAGVGVGTVSRVLNGGKSVNENTRRLVEEAIAKLSYTPNSSAKRLRQNRSGVIALMIPVLDHPFFSKFAEAAEQAADGRGYSTLLVVSQQHVEKEKRIIERIKRKEVDGAIFVTHYEHDRADFRGCPLVSIDRHLDGDIPCVTSDNGQATKKSIEYLIAKGCKRIGYIGTKPLVDSEILLREKVYREVIEAHGMEARVVNEVAIHGEEGALVEKFFKTYGDVDGIFAAGYTVARLAAEHARAIGRRVPDDVQIVSYDMGYPSWDSSAALTCVEQPIEEMARAAVGILIDKIDGKPTAPRTVLESRFVIGNSTR